MIQPIEEAGQQSTVRASNQLEPVLNQGVGGHEQVESTANHMEGYGSVSVLCDHHDCQWVYETYQYFARDLELTMNSPPAYPNEGASYFAPVLDQGVEQVESTAYHMEGYGLGSVSIICDRWDIYLFTRTN